MYKKLPLLNTLLACTFCSVFLQDILGEKYEMLFDVKNVSDIDNMYQFQWELIPNHSWMDLYYQLHWNYSRRACLKDQTHKFMGFNKSDHEFRMPLEPYARFNFQMIVYGTTMNEITRSKTQNVSTYIDDTIYEDEKPKIIEIQADKTSFHVFFNKMHCTDLKGPLYINYKAIGEEHWCDPRPPTYVSAIKFPFDTHRMVIPSLTEYCNYNVTIYISRKTDEWISATALKSFRKQTEGMVIAKPVENLTVTSNGKDHIRLRWKLNPKPNGKLKEYKIMIELPSGLSNSYTLAANDVKNCTLWPGYQCHEVMQEMLEAKRYIISIVSVNVNNLNDAKLKEQIEYAYNRNLFQQIKVFTKESAPEKPLNVHIRWKNPSTLDVYWKHPNKTNGHLTKFKILKTIIYNSSPQNTSDTLQINGASDYKYEYHKETDLSVDPSQHVNALQISVAACNSVNCSEYSTPCEPGPPKPLDYTGTIQPRGLTLHIQKPSFDAFFDKLLIFKASPETQEENETLIELLIPKIEAQLRRGKFGHTDYSINKLIYVESNKSIINSTTILGGTNDTFQNGTTYTISVFIVNKLNNQREVGTTIKVRTLKLSDANFISRNDLILIWLSILIFVLTTTFAVFAVYRYRHKILVPKTIFEDVIYSEAEDVRPLTFVIDDQIEEEINKGTQRETLTEFIQPIHSKRIKIDDLRKYIKTSLETNELDRQLKLFPKSEVLIRKDTRFTCYFGSLSQNKPKNRYNSLIAYDHSRVILNRLPRDDYSDYINANYIHGYRISKAYIATQGPQKNTLNDFWRMVWEQNVKHIVMLNKLFEGDRKECEKYWPEVNEKLIFDQIQVEHINVTRNTTYDVRNLRIHFKGSSRQVSQIQFKCWSAVGQPLYPQTLVPLLQKLLTLPYSGTTPILVHCSAGTGRTGTVILCDICLRMASVEFAVDFLRSLERLRNQRPNMVNNVDQYKLAHLAVLACLNAWDTSITCDANFETNIETLLEDGVVEKVMSYLRDSEWQDNAMKARVVPHQVPTESEKNRYEDIVPEVPYQVLLQPSLGQAHTSTYVNAIRVNSFKFSDRFIVTQHPMPNTLGDFWRMVSEQQCTVLINLNEFNPVDKTSIQFWPEQESQINLEDRTIIRHVKTHVAKEFDIVTVRVSYRPNVIEITTLTVEILNYKSWNHQSALPENMDDFVSFVVDSAVICRKSHPVLVTCHDGATASGLYVALSNLIDEMKLEQKCDICKTVRTLRTCRKQFVNKEIQLGFLYNAAVFYHNSWGLYQDLEFK